MPHEKNKSIISKNPFIIFAPFLLLYIILVFIFPTHSTFGDESRYLFYAEYIFNGFHSDTYTNFDYLGNGPGYPIILLPIVALHLPIICCTLLNAVLYYLSIVLLFKVFLKFGSFSHALILSLFWACYYNLYESVIIIYSEVFCTFLICLLILCLLNAFSDVFSKKYIFLAGFLIGFIALTKPIFGYVLLCMLIGCGLLWIINRKVVNYRKALTILFIALATTTPYLIYTYHITGKTFYWSSFGGNNLYWMSTPFEGEYGDWFRDPKPNAYPILNKKMVPGYGDSILSKYQKDFVEINKHKGVEKDDTYKRIAISNIKSHPLKFFKNCITNLGRILFNYPYSYTLQNPATLARLPLNGIIVVLLLFCLIPTFINWKKIPFPIRFLIFFALLYLGGSILGSAETRMFTVIVPILLVWIAFILQKTVRINMQKWVN